MNIIFFSNARNVFFRCIFREKIIFTFWQKGNFIFVEKRNTAFTNIQKTSNIIFHFPSVKKNIVFSGKRNPIFPHDIKNIIFQWDFFGKIIFSEHLEKKIWFFVQCLWQYFRDEQALDSNNNIIDFPADNNNSTLFKFKQQITGQIGNGGIKNNEIMIPLKYLGNFGKHLKCL